MLAVGNLLLDVVSYDVHLWGLISMARSVPLAGRKALNLLVVVSGPTVNDSCGIAFMCRHE